MTRGNLDACAPRVEMIAHVLDSPEGRLQGGTRDVR